MKKSIIIKSISVLFLTAVLLSGCSSEASSISYAEEYPGFKSEAIKNNNEKQVYLPVGTYDSADTAIIDSINTEESTITLYNTYAGRTYTLNYDGTTYISDKYGTAMTMNQLKAGQIVNVNFLKSKKQLVDIQISPEAWSYDNITKYDLNGPNSTAVIGDRTYSLAGGTRVYSQGMRTDMMGIVPGDVLTVSGIGYDIYSICVDGGHGYVRLYNEAALVGGWIEIGNQTISKVSEGMLIAVPEGNYTVKMYNAYSSASQDIIVERNQEVILDCSTITAPEDIFGRIKFALNPPGAKLYLDGVEQNANDYVKTSYGIHQIEVEASGYDTLSKYINVGTELAEITISLNESQDLSVFDEADNSTISDNNTISGNNTQISSPTTNLNAQTISGQNNYNNGTAWIGGSNNLSGLTVSGNNNTASGNAANTASGNAANTASGNNSVTGSTGIVENAFITEVHKNPGENLVILFSPTGVEVYVDGVYKGIAPVSFVKTEGTHTITLKEQGFATTSYSVNFLNDGQDVSLSFSSLERE